MPDKNRNRVSDHRSDVLRGSLPQGPSAHPRNTEDQGIRGWAKRTRRRVEMKQLREVWRSCTRDNVEADERFYQGGPMERITVISMLHPKRRWFLMIQLFEQPTVRWRELDSPIHYQIIIHKLWIKKTHQIIDLQLLLQLRNNYDSAYTLEL